MAPTIPVSGALADNAASVAIPGSSGYVVGDRRYVALTLSSGPTPTTPTGWTKTVDTQVGTTTTRRLYLFERDAVGNDPGFTITFSGASNYSAVWFATRGGLATIIGPSTATAETGTAMAAPSQTTTLADSLLIGFFASLNSSSSVANTTPTGMTSVESVVPSGGAGHVARLAYEIRPTAGATGTRTSTAQVSARWVALSFAVSPSGAADPIWVGDAETGDFSQLADPSGGVDQLSPQTRAVLTSPVRSGSYAFEFAVNGTASGSPNTQRSEGRASGLGFAEGDDRWIGGSVRLPSGFPTNPGAFQVVMQLKADVNGTPPVTLNVESGQLQLQGGFGRPAGSLPMPAKTLVSSMAAGVWYDVLLHVKFSSDPAVGEVTVWVNGTQVLAPYKPPGGTMYATYPSYFKIGLYRDPTLATSSATRVYHDEWRVGSTRAAVELSGTTVLADATLTGAGTLTAAAGQNHAAAATVVGRGQVTAAAGQTHTAGAALTGRGMLTGDATREVTAAATLTAAGEVTADAARGQAVSAALTGAGVLTAAPGAAGSAILTGAGTLTADLAQDHLTDAALTGAGTLTGVPGQDHLIAANAVAAGVVSAQAAGDQPMTATLTGSGTVAAAATRVQPGSALLVGSGALIAPATRTTLTGATLTGRGTLTAAAVGGAAGALNVSVWAVDPDGGALTPLPDWTKVEFTRIRDSPGAISLEYPASGSGFEALRGNVTADRDLEVEIWLGGRQSTALRGILNTAAGDDVAETAVWTFTGSFLEWLLAEAVVFHQPAADKQELRFSAATPGAVVSTLLTQAQARGALAGMSKDFTAALDSSGQPWPELVTIKFSPGSNYLAVMQRLVELNLLDFEVTPARVLRCYAPGRMGVDRTVGPTPTVIRRGRNVTESPRRHSVAGSITAVLAAGAEGIYAAASDPAALTRRGRRVEGSASSNNLVDLGAVQAFGGKTLQTRGPGEMELLIGLSFGVGHPRPQTHYLVSDWVFADTVGVLERLRVAQLTVSVDSSGPSGSVTLNDLRTDWRIRAERRLNALSDGDVVIGTSTQSPGEDTVAPGPPTSITLGSTAYQVGGVDGAVVTVGWTAPVANADGSPLFDLAGFRARLEAPGSAPGVFTTSPDVGASANSLQFSGVQTGIDVRVQVQAFDRDGNASAWSTPADHTTESDLTPPPAPSTPDLSPYLGQLRIRWDGLGAGGSPMPLDLDRVEVHLSQANNFAPSSATLYDQFATIAGERIATDLTYGVGYYVRLVAVDVTGNRSVPSATASAVPSKVVADDVFAGAIGTAQLANLAVTTAKINLLAVNDAQIGNLGVGKLTAGTMTADVILAGIFRTATTGRRMEIDSGGWRAYKADGTTKFAELAIAAETMTVTGTYQSGLSGERIRILPDGTFQLYGATTADYAEIANVGGIVRMRSRADPNGRRSYVDFDPTGLSAYYGVAGGTVRSSFLTGLTYGVLTAGAVGFRVDRRFAPSDGTDWRVFLTNSTNGTPSGDVGASVLHYQQLDSNLNCAAWLAPVRNCGVVWGSSEMWMTTASGLSFGAVGASAFNINSSLTVKSRVMPARFGAGRTYRDVVQTARAVEYEYTDEGRRPDRPDAQLRDDDGTLRDVEWDMPPWEPAKRYGPIAEHLLRIDPKLVQRRPGRGDLVLNVANIAGLAWGAAGEAHDRIDDVEAVVRRMWRDVETLRARLDGEVLEGEVV